MFGASKILSSSIGRENITVTQGNYITFYGFYDDGLFSPANDIGSVSPTDLKGQHINGLFWATAGPDVDTFLVWIEGNRAQTFFHSVTPEGHSKLLSADADSFLYDGTYDYTYWRWETLNIPAEWDGTGDLTVVFTGV